MCFGSMYQLKIALHFKLLVTLVSFFCNGLSLVYRQKDDDEDLFQKRDSSAVFKRDLFLNYQLNLLLRSFVIPKKIHNKHFSHFVCVVHRSFWYLKTEFKNFIISTKNAMLHCLQKFYFRWIHCHIFLQVTVNFYVHWPPPGGIFSGSEKYAPSIFILSMSSFGGAQFPLNISINAYERKKSSRRQQQPTIIYTEIHNNSYEFITIISEFHLS